MKSFRKVVDNLKNYWMRFALHNVGYSNDYKRMNTVYLLANPWRLDSAWERYRFEETNRLISKNFGRVGSLLEVGCGEGYQSLYLQQICDHITGLDVSRRAVERARRMCPNGDFLVGNLFSKAAGMKAPFDLVVACEVLYYMKDVSASLQRLHSLGRNCLVTYFAREMPNLDPQVFSMPGIISEIIEYRDARWRIAWWPGAWS
jgi:SAM-dependent methyltransferase